jgi:4-hydroxy-L-threonine phosphate dehydrogenase PdxA
MKPIVVITMGDAAVIGPEIILKSLNLKYWIHNLDIVIKPY